MSDFTFTDAALTAIDSVSLMVVPTAPDDESYDRARAAALEIATRASCRVVLHDRSDERWTDTPHPDGPHSADQVGQHGRDHLVQQMAAFADAGVQVEAWYASVPAITSVLTPVQTLGADAIVLPESIDNPKLMDRLQAGSDVGEKVGRVLDQNLARSVRVFVVGDDGAVEVANTVDNTDRPD